jgi:hypothetical protein
VHQVGYKKLIDIMMHGQRNIKIIISCLLLIYASNFTLGMAYILDRQFGKKPPPRVDITDGFTIYFHDVITNLTQRKLKYYITLQKTLCFSITIPTSQ